MWLAFFILVPLLSLAVSIRLEINWGTVIFILYSSLRPSHHLLASQLHISQRILNCSLPLILC